ncbi:MAG: hypothetical protein IKL31_07475 [Ruminococcus sp.]|nr:hypothetical protein [Ruminococcus sp.]
MDSLFYFIYSQQDIGHIERLRKKLYELGMETPSPDSFVSAESDFATQMKAQISAAKGKKYQVIRNRTLSHFIQADYGEYSDTGAADRGNGFIL